MVPERMKEVSALKVRIRFEKEGAMKFIGHLDIMRYFQKAFRRSGLDIQYSQGFSPHPLLSFAAPLGVGLESSGEYMDVVLGDCPSSQEIVDRLNAQMVEGMRILSAVILPEDGKNAMSLVAAADYEMILKKEAEFSLEDGIEAMLGQEQIKVLKKTKKSQKEVDIRPMIYDMHVMKDAKGTGIFMRVASGSAANLKPEQVAQTLWESQGHKFDPLTVQIRRLEMYDSQMSPLEKYGEIHP